MMKFLKILLVGLVLLAIGIFCLAYFVHYSEGVRAGELVKFSSKGVIFKTWEGEISQGVSEAQLFEFSVEGGEDQVVQDLQNFQGKYVKLHYYERFVTLFWLGDTTYFVTKVEEDVERNNRRF
ncbi:MAG: 6-phosphogluconate dehydrogenase [Aquaticitalea sp.]